MFEIVHCNIVHDRVLIMKRGSIMLKLCCVEDFFINGNQNKLSWVIWCLSGDKIHLYKACLLYTSDAADEAADE